MHGQNHIKFEHVSLKIAERVGYTQAPSTGLASTNCIHSFINVVACSCASRNTVP